MQSIGVGMDGGLGIKDCSADLGSRQDGKARTIEVAWKPLGWHREWLE